MLQKRKEQAPQLQKNWATQKKVINLLPYWFAMRHQFTRMCYFFIKLSKDFQREAVYTGPNTKPINSQPNPKSLLEKLKPSS